MKVRVDRGTIMDNAITSVGVLHPGQMGSAVAAAASASGVRVLWASAGRSEATRARAAADHLEDVQSLGALVAQSDVILSVVPPGNAEEIAASVASLGFDRLYIDANAVAPETTRRIAAGIEAAGGHFVDGGIIGGPPRHPGNARLYLAGDAAPRVAACFEDGPLDVTVLDAPAGAGSALKMAYAAWTKGTTALLAAVEALALREHVHDELYAEWTRSQPGLIERSARAGSSGAKAWRWVSEMEEIAAAFEAAGLPPGFHEAAAEVYRRLEQFKDDTATPGGADLAGHLLPSSSAVG
jgi:3-hydroxyisobutyrate dehydrogenase-like beta-hydroxyacid dehydrogenase